MYCTVAETTIRAVFLTPRGSLMMKDQAPVFTGNFVIICHSLRCNILLFLFVIAIKVG
jgi:hypothetical protein